MACPDPLPPHLRLCRCKLNRPTFNNGPTASKVRPISPSPSMRSNSHRGSISSTRLCASPAPSSVGMTMKRPLSPGPDNIYAKRMEVEIPVRKASPPASVLSSFARTILHTTIISYTAFTGFADQESRPALAEFPLVILATTRVYHRDHRCGRPEWHRL
jgi:hypothetical protein